MSALRLCLALATVAGAFLALAFAWKGDRS